MSAQDRLDSYLEQMRKRLRLGVLARGAAIVVSAALAATVVLVLITNAFAFSERSLISARGALFLALALAAGFGIALPLYGLNRRRAASRAEVVFPQFQQRLVTFADRDPGKREPFIELLAADTMELARAAKPAHLVPDRKLLVALAVGVASLGMLIWMIAAGPGYLGYGAARLWSGSPHGVAAFYDIRVSPGDATVRRNSNQTVRAQLVGLETNQVYLYARYRSASKWEQAAMQPENGASDFQFVFAGVPEDVEYYVEAGPLRSRHFNLRVADLPSIKQIRVTYHFPAWTGLQNAAGQNGGDLRAVEGTEAELAVLTDRPLNDGVLVLDNKQELALAGGQGNLYKGMIRIERDGLYHVAALDHGQRVRLSDDFYIEARKANPPEVSITRPGGDYRASPIEEVTVSVKAQGDFGLSDVGLHYSVNGGPDHTVEMLKQKGGKEAEGTATIYLEDFKLVPGDVVSLYATAKDARSESRSDMSFIEAEPFERDYSQSQVAGGGGGGLGGDQYEIAQREKEIIAATWKQQGDKQASRQQAAGAAKFLSGVQAKLRDQALSLAGRLQKRELTEENQEFSSFQQDMNAAAEAMGPASEKLRQQKWRDAIPTEQKALQYLLRAEATFRQIQVAFGSGGGGGGGAGAGRDLANLFDLELDTEKNQYETGQTADSAKQRAQEIDKALQKLDELARREQELAEQQHSNNGQSVQQRWQQEMLRREAEQLQRQMEQLAQGNQQGSSQQGSQRGSSQQAGSASSGQAANGGSHGVADQRIQQALDSLRQANEDLSRASSQGQNGAEARRAADRLQEARNLLNGIPQEQAPGQLDSLAREADRLASAQQDQAARMRKMFGPQGSQNRLGQGQFDAGSDEQSKLADERQLLANDLSRLEKAMQDAARNLRASEPSAASKLHEALGGMDQADLQARLQRSAESIREGTGADSNSIEPAIGAGLERLRQQLHEAQQAVSGPEQGGPEEALNRVERLRRQMEALTQRLGDRNAAGRQAGQQSQSGQGPSAQQGQQGQGGQGQQAGVSQQGQGGQRGQGGSGNQGQQGQGSQSQGANSGFQHGGPGGPRTWQGGLNAGGYIQPYGAGGQPSSDATGASVELTLSGVLRELNGLRQDLRGEPESLADVQELIRELQRLGPGNFPGNPALVDQLRTQVLANVDKLELQLRRDLDAQQSGQIRGGDSYHVPEGYQDPVAEYFRRLSQRR
jgi:hypothetical protein